MKMMKSLSRGLTSLIADCSRIVAANLGGERVYRKAALAREALGFRDWLKRREHQQLSVGAGSEVFPARLEIWPEATRNYCNKRERRFTHGLRDRLLSRRYATRYHNSAALAVENRFFSNCRNFAFSRSSRNLDKHFIGSIQKKVVANGVAPLIIREYDRARHLEKLWVLHDSPASFNILADVGRHSFKLTFRKENRIVEPRKPEGGRAVEKCRCIKRSVCLGAGNFEASYNFAERRLKALVYPDNAMKMIRHHDVLARLDLGENRAEIPPSFGNLEAKGRKNHFAAGDSAENRPPLFHRKRNHINPGLAIIPTREANSGFKVTIFITAIVHGGHYSKKRRTAHWVRLAEPGARQAGRAKRTLCAENLKGDSKWHS